MIGEHLKVVRGFITKHTVRQFADKYGLVYFGHVSPRDDEYELVRGVTVSTTHVDNHYTVGTINGRDVIFVERSNKLHFPGKQPARYDWLILQIDLRCSGLPHVFIDVRQQDETFYTALFAKLPQFKDITAIFSGRDDTLTRLGIVFGYPQYYAEIGDMLVPQITAPLVNEFKQFDYEISGDKVYVYASKTHPTLSALKDMVSVGLWLADQLETVVIS